MPTLLSEEEQDVNDSERREEKLLKGLGNF
jgi:hypothetical protein